MKLAISLLNRNGLYDTIECIDTLLQSDFLDYTIYLLDNGSHNPDEYKILQDKYSKNPHIILHHSSTNLGFTGGNNYNFKLIMNTEGYDFIMVLNNDCKIERRFLGEFLESIKHIDKEGIFGPIIKGYDGSIQAAGCTINLWTGASTRYTSITQSYDIVDYVTGSCMVISTSILPLIGQFDDRYFAYREEADLCLRARDHGYYSYIINKEGIYHKEEAANKKTRPYYTYLMFRNRLLFLKQHATYIQYIFSRIVLGIYIIIIFPFTFGIKNYKYLWMALQDGTHNKFGRRVI